MDSKDRIIEQIKILLPYMTEEILISLSNKGTVNRAKKDLEKLQNSITLSLTSDDHALITIGEEASITLGDTIGECRCSCPSVSMCRHIVTALLYASAYLLSSSDAKQEADNDDFTELTNIKQEAVKITSDDFPELNKLTQEEVISLVGKKDFSSLLSSIRLKNDAIFSYDEILTVTIESQGATVYFPRANSTTGVLCSCKEKRYCRHKSYALLSYLLTERNIVFKSEENSIEIGEKEIVFLKQIQNQIAEYLDLGISSLTENIVKELERSYIHAYGLKLFRLATELKMLSAEMVYYFSKIVTFSNLRTMHLLCKIYNRAAALLSNRSEEQKNLLIGKLKEESFLLDELNVIGLGAVARKTKRQDLLVCAYFYSLELKSILILSTLRSPDGNKIEYLASYLYNTGLVWADEYSINTISSSKLTLKNAQLTSDKLSGTKSTSCQILRKTTEEDIKNIAAEDYSVLLDQIKLKSYQYFAPYSEADTIYMIKAARIDEVNYDKIKQCLYFSAYDSLDNKIVFEIRYSDVTEKAIGYMERYKRYSPFTYLLGSFSLQKDKLQAVFLSGIIESKVVSPYFE